MKTKFYLFRDVSDVKVLNAGETLFSQGDPGKLAYVIQQGEIGIFANGQWLETAEAGDILGEMVLIDHQPRNATAIASTDCTLVPIDEDRFQFMVQETPCFALGVLHVMSQRLRQVNAEYVHQGATLPSV